MIDSTSLSAFESFEQTLGEVDALLECSEANAASTDLSATLNKCAVLLLTGKFEAFAESAAEEYVFAVSQISTRNEFIPETLRITHTFNLLRSIDQYRDPSRSADAIRLFSEVADAWTANHKIGALNIDCKFSYGKHGETELKKLLASVGFSDVFELVQVVSKKESLLSETGEEEQLDFRGIFNSLTSIRNNILHQDASPTLTVEEMREFRSQFSSFAAGLTRVMLGRLKSIVALAGAGT